jgi:hypothetical protein
VTQLEPDGLLSSMSARRGSSAEWEGRLHLGRTWRPGTRREAATLAADEENLSIRSSRGSINLGPGGVLRIERAGPLPWFWRGVLIHHRRQQYPTGICFVPSNATTQELLEQLLEFGYPVWM